MHGKILGLMGLGVALAGTASAVLFGTDYNNIEYLCCDWGSALPLPTKTNEVAQFIETEDEVYFLKQVTSFTRKKRLVPDLFSNQDHEDIGKGLSIYLCKMKPDGSAKTEIKELWRDPAYPISTQMQSTWMDVNRKTHTIALSIIFAGSDLTGLWSVKQDGSELHKIIKPSLIEGHLQAIDSPSWTPDGKWIVFAEAQRGEGGRGRIAKCDRQGQKLIYLTEGPGDCQSRVSPSGQEIVYIHWIIKGNVQDSWLWLMNINGTNPRPLPNPEAKKFWPAQAHWGTYPTWSPDGKQILSSRCIIDTTSGNTLIDREPQYKGKPYTYGWPHWGKAGIVGYNVGGILFTDSELREAKWIGSSGLSKCFGKADADRW